MQRIEIKNFGPINELKLDIKDFMLFIGPQASGKSTIAKTIFFFKSLNDDLVKYLVSALKKNDFAKPMETYVKIIRQKFLDYFGANIHLPAIYLKYHYSDSVWITVPSKHDNGYIVPEFSKVFEDTVKQLVQKAQEFYDSVMSKDPLLLISSDMVQIGDRKREFISQVTQECNRLFGDERELIFIPAGRSLLATLADQLQFIDPRKLDFLMRTFVTKINLLKPVFKQSLNQIVNARKLLTQSEIDMNRTKLAEEIIGKILKGKYQCDNGEERIYIDNSDKYVKLNFTSSGQQESLWILLLIFIIILEQQNVFVVIEEPEAHLFPEAQKEISALIALLSDMKQSQVIITTHSPYILASVNNLILAHKIGKRFPEKVIPKINKHLWINRDKIFAAMVQSGVVSEIIDPEFDIIQQEHIDSVSQIINEEFDYLYQYETADNA